MEIRNIDIFGNYNGNKDNKEDSSKSSTNKKSIFPSINLENGLNSNQLQLDFGLIHRILQKKLSYN